VQCNSSLTGKQLQEPRSFYHQLFLGTETLQPSHHFGFVYFRKKRLGLQLPSSTQSPKKSRTAQSRGGTAGNKILSVQRNRKVWQKLPGLESFIFSRMGACWVTVPPTPVAGTAAAATNNPLPQLASSQSLALFPMLQQVQLVLARLKRLKQGGFPG